MPIYMCESMESLLLDASDLLRFIGLGILRSVKICQELFSFVGSREEFLRFLGVDTLLFFVALRFVKIC